MFIQNSSKDERKCLLSLSANVPLEWLLLKVDFLLQVHLHRANTNFFSSIFVAAHCEHLIVFFDEPS